MNTLFILLTPKLAAELSPERLKRLFIRGATDYGSIRFDDRPIPPPRPRKPGAQVITVRITPPDLGLCPFCDIRPEPSELFVHVMHLCSKRPVCIPVDATPEPRWEKD